MHDVEAKNPPTQSGGWLPLRSALKLFHAQLAVHYPTYTWSFASIDKLKLLMMFAAQYLTIGVKMMVI